MITVTQLREWRLALEDAAAKSAWPMAKIVAREIERVEQDIYRAEAHERETRPEPLSMVYEADDGDEPGAGDVIEFRPKGEGE